MAIADHLIDNWRGEIRRLWSLRVAIGGTLFWSVAASVWAIWPAFAEVIPLWMLTIGAITLGPSIALARLLKQPGADT